MGFVRKSDRDQRIHGGVATYRTPYGVITLVYAKPTPERSRLVGPDAVALASKMRRGALELTRYLTGDELNDAPRIVFDESEIRPILDFCRIHLMKVIGLNDEMTGEVISLEELDAEEIDDLLMMLAIKENERIVSLLHLYKSIEQSNGLKGDQRARLKKYLEIQYIESGCNCERCEEIKDEDPRCRFASLRPMDDVAWMLEQYNIFAGESKSRQPRWILEIFAIVDAAVRRRRELEEEEKEAAKLLEKHTGGV